MKRISGEAVAIASAFFLLGGTCLAASPRPVDNSMPARFGYHSCLNRELSKILSYDPGNPDLYALTKLRDEDVFPLIKSRCADTRASLLASAGDRQRINLVLDEVDAENQDTVLDVLKRARPDIEEKVRMIRAPAPRPAVPLAEMGVTFDDYPMAALRNNEQGTSRATYTVGVDGRASECTAEGTTETLNAATCRLIELRWRYAPAIDATGAPVSEVRNKALTFSIR